MTEVDDTATADDVDAYRGGRTARINRAEVPTLEYEGRTFRFPWRGRQPPLDPRAKERLRQSIERRGVRVPVVLDEQDNVIDGDNRLHLAHELGIGLDAIPLNTMPGLTEEEKQARVDSLNEDRRQQTQEEIEARASERREKVKRLAAQGKKTREIAAEVGVSQGQVVRDLAKASEAETGDSAAQPAQKVGRPKGGQKAKPAEPPAPAPAPEPAAPPQLIDYVNLIDSGATLRDAAESVDVPESTLRTWMARWADQVARHRAGLKKEADARRAEVEKNIVRDEFGRKVPPSLEPIFDLRQGFAEAKQRQLLTTAFLDRILQMPLFNAEGAAKNVSRGALQDSKNLFQHLKCGVPFAVCPGCKGKGCGHCKNLGWLTFDAADGLRRQPSGKGLFAPCPDCPGKGCKKCRGLKCVPKE